jgi:hypothetical protein
MNKTDLDIEQFNLRLPQQFSGRANGIGREVVKQLANLEVTHSIQLNRLDLPKLSIQGGETNQTIARKIVNSVQKHITQQINQGN